MTVITLFMAVITLVYDCLVYDCLHALSKTGLTSAGPQKCASIRRGNVIRWSR